jgi:hypothetical protein
MRCMPVVRKCFFLLNQNPCIFFSLNAIQDSQTSYTAGKEHPQDPEPQPSSSNYQATAEKPHVHPSYAVAIPRQRSFRDYSTGPACPSLLHRLSRIEIYTTHQLISIEIRYSKVLFPELRILDSKKKRKIANYAGSGTYQV